MNAGTEQRKLAARAERADRLGREWRRWTRRYGSQREPFHLTGRHFQSHPPVLAGVALAC